MLKQKKFTDDAIENIKNVSKDNATRYRSEDTGFKITLASKDIKRSC